ncbi:MAG: hypothetical protein KDN19_02235 [Verrucomicrobiae bacterium]|nr:hypothetical protein [Verrucomicrobiae bacterium]
MEALFGFLTILSFAALIGFRHSFFMVPLIVFLSIWVEDFFPLSHFPMYSDPNESENYFYVATMDDKGEPEALPVRKMTSITAPKVKKMYKSWAREYADERDKSDRDLTKEERAEVGRNLLAFLRSQAEQRHEVLPDNLALVEVWIVYDDDEGFSETPEVVAVLPAGDKVSS